MIYSANQAGFNQQPEGRTIHLLNKQGSFMASSQTPQKPIYYRSQSGQSQGQILFQQGIQVPEISQPQQLNGKKQALIQNQPVHNANFFGNTTVQQQNELNSLDKFIKIANINQALQRSISGSVNQQQQQQQQQQQKQQIAISQHNNSGQSANNQSHLIQNSNYSQHSMPIIQMRNGGELNQKQQNEYQNVNNRQQIGYPATQLQPINRQSSIQIINSGSAYIPSKNSQIMPSQRSGQENIKIQNITDSLTDVHNKIHSNSFHDIKCEKMLTSSPLRVSSIIGNTMRDSTSQSNIQKYNYTQSPAGTVNSQNIIQQKQQQPTIQRQELQIKNKPLQTFTQSAQQNANFNQQNLIGFYNLNNLSQTQQYQAFIPISTSSPATHSAYNNDLKLSLQQITNSVPFQTDSPIYKTQPIQFDINSSLRQSQDVQQALFGRDSSPYDKLIKGKRSARSEINSLINQSIQNNRSYQNQIDQIQEENNIITPRKEFILNNSERSDMKIIDTTDTEIRERVCSYANNQAIYSQVDGNLVNSIYKTTEGDNNDHLFSPKLKLNMKEKKYGNEDLCNFCPVTHILAQDLQKYDLIIKCTLQTQNQSTINQKIKDFSEGFQFSAL